MRASKFVVIIVAVLSVSTAYAQFNQGRFLAGGSLSLNAYGTEYKVVNATAKTTVFTVTPQVGYFVINQLAVGAGLTLQSQSTKFDGSSNKSNGTYFIFSPFVRYYLEQKIFFQSSAGFGSNKSTITNGNTTTSSTEDVFQWSLGAGYAYFLNDFVAIEPLIGYQSTSRKDNSANSKLVNGGLFVQIGIQVYLGNRN